MLFTLILCTITGLPSRTVDRGSLSASLAPNSGQSPSFTPMPTNVPAPRDNVGNLSSSVDPSDNPSVYVSPTDSSSDNVVLIVTIVVGALLLALAVVGVIVLMIVLIRWRRKNKLRTHDTPQTGGNFSG